MSEYIKSPYKEVGIPKMAASMYNRSQKTIHQSQWNSKKRKKGK